MPNPEPERKEWFELLQNTATKSEKSWWVTLWLSLFLGLFGADRFYLGYSLLSFAKLCTAGGVGYWWIGDLVYLLMGKMKDSEGRVVKRKA